MSKTSILYVDDEEDNLITFKSVFRRDFQVYTAISGQEALEQLTYNQVDILVTDQRMPKMTGVDLLRKVFEKYPGIFRVVLTGFSDVDDIIDAINIGKVHAYLSKPWQKESLQKQLTDVLELSNGLTLAHKKIEQLQIEISELKKKNS